MKKLLLITAGLMLLGGNAFAKDVQYDLRVDGMTCPFCAATSEKALKKIKGVSAVSTDLKKATISVCAAEDTDMSDPKLSKLLKKKGFTYVNKTKQEVCSISAGKTDVKKTGFLRGFFHKHS
ncbi:MAG: hypothetical protein COB36_13350 [Alphaproteobacteria bacterium]|nr:MAG: hypothetical protein COB36_13350 [Alphaproteobacteria bacterium]